jgi:hypothetical protein
MNPHILKWTPTLGVGVLMDSWIFRENLHGWKPIEWRYSLYHWKDIETWMFKMGSHDPFGHLTHKLWAKERPGVKLVDWFPPIKSEKSPWFPYVKVACDIPLESSWQGIKLFFRPHLNQRFTHKVMGPQSHGSPNFGNFGTPTWESRDKMPFECWSHDHAYNIL